MSFLKSWTIQMWCCLAMVIGVLMTIGGIMWVMALANHIDRHMCLAGGASCLGNYIVKVRRDRQKGN